MEFYWRVVSFFTLWKTSIQSVEGKHGKKVSHAMTLHQILAVTTDPAGDLCM